MPIAPQLLRRLLPALACAWLPALAVHAAESQSVVLGIVQLRELGIALDLAAVEPARRPRVPAGADRPFPNRCFGMVSVSDELLARMQAQGFSLATLCIGLDSPHVAFHPETGAPLTSVRVRYQQAEEGIPDDPRGMLELLIDIPKCFARGNAYVDCTMRHEWMGGGRNKPDERDGYAQKGRHIGELVKRLRARGFFERSCTCADFRRPDPDNDGGPELRDGATCLAASVPSCPRPPSRFALAGSLMYDFQSWRLGSDEKLLQRLASPGDPDPMDWGTLNEVFEISPDRPNGYAYRVMTPEGETGKAMVSLQKGRIVSVGAK